VKISERRYADNVKLQVNAKTGLRRTVRQQRGLGLSMEIRIFVEELLSAGL
jgi:hypothetical protein